MKERRDTFQNTGIKQTVIDEIIHLATVYQVKKVILFGSRARGDFREKSDIDLAVQGGDYQRFSLAVDDETSTLLKYDIVLLDGAVQEELRKVIREEGLIIYEEIR